MATAAADTEEAEITKIEAAEAAIAEGILGNASTFETRGVAVSGTNVVSHTRAAEEAEGTDLAFRTHQGGIMGDVSDAPNNLEVMTTIAVLLADVAVMEIKITETTLEEVLAGVEEESAFPFATTAIADTEKTANFPTNDYASLLYSWVEAQVPFDLKLKRWSEAGYNPPRIGILSKIYRLKF